MRISNLIVFLQNILIKDTLAHSLVLHHRIQSGWKRVENEIPGDVLSLMQMILLSTKNFKFLQIVVHQSGGSILPSPSEIQKYKNQQLNDSFFYICHFGRTGQPLKIVRIRFIE